MKTLSTIALLLLISFAGAGQESADTLFNTKDYHEFSKKPWPPYNYIISYQHNTDKSLFIRKAYSDSTYKTLLAQMHYVNDSMEGVYELYLDKSIMRGQRKGDKEDGMFVIINTQSPTPKIFQKSFYTMGVKTGTWEYYDADGVLFKTKIYDNAGNLLKTIDNGKYPRILDRAPEP